MSILTELQKPFQLRRECMGYVILIRESIYGRETIKCSNATNQHRTRGH